MLVSDTLVPYVKCHEFFFNVSFLLEIIKVWNASMQFLTIAPLKQHRFTATVSYAMKLPPLN